MSYSGIDNIDWYSLHKDTQKSFLILWKVVLSTSYVTSSSSHFIVTVPLVSSAQLLSLTHRNGWCWISTQKIHFYSLIENQPVKIGSVNIRQVSVACFMSLNLVSYMCFKMMKPRKKYGFFSDRWKRSVGIKKSKVCYLSSGNHYSISQREHVGTFLNIE